MADQHHIKSHGMHLPQSSTERGHPWPRRTSPEKSVTLRHHRLARDATLKAQAKTAQDARPSSPRRHSSGASHQTRNSDPKNWFDRSNRNPTATYDDPSNMDVDPPFYQQETDSSNEEARGLRGGPSGDALYPFGQAARGPPHLRPAATHSSSADDYRSVIDDLTIENKRLKEELKRYRQFGPDMMKKDKLFEIKVHGLPNRKKRELEATLRDFAAGLEGSSEATSQRRKPGRHLKDLYSSGASLSKHASSSSSNSRPVDSAYASMSTGPSSAAPQSSAGPLQGRPSAGSRAKSTQRKVEHYLEDMPDGLLPRPVVLTDKEKKKLVVRRLEQLFTGKISGRNMHRNQSMPSLESTQALTDAYPPAAALGPPLNNPEASRKARILPSDPAGKKARSRDNISQSNSGDQTESVGAHGTGDGGSGNRSANNTSPPTILPPEQRPTRPRDLDPDRVQIPSENLDYIRHLGLVPPEFLVDKKAMRQDVSPDADGWVYLNLLCNLAQLHIFSVTPSFIRSAVSEKSKKFQLSPDGRKIRWRGGTDGTKFSSDSSGDNSQRSPSTDDTDASNDEGSRKRLKSASGEAIASGASSKQSRSAVGQVSGSSGDFHYKPMFVHQSSSMETSLDDTGSQASYGAVDDSNPNQSRWDYSGSGSSQRKKRRHDGAIIYYSGAPFCTDLSGDPGDMSPTTYMTSTGQERDLDLRAFRPVQQRTISGSSLVIRPLSDDKAIVSEAMDMDLDSPPDLVTDDGDSANDVDFEFPWADDASSVPAVPSFPLQPCLEPCGLNGVVPEDHFVVLCQTRRPVLKPQTAMKPCRARSEDITESIAGRLATMSTSSPAPPQRHRSREPPVEVTYLSGKIRRLKPVALPPPAMFIPPFSTDSDTDGYDDELHSDSSSSSEESFSQRANPHQSEEDSEPENNTYPDHEELSGDDEEDEIDEDEGDHLAVANVRGVGPTGRVAALGKIGGLVGGTGSSAATAGGEESGYTSSMEDDAVTK